MSEASPKLKIPEIGYLVDSRPDGAPDYGRLIEWAKEQPLAFYTDEQMIAGIKVSIDGDECEVGYVNPGVNKCRITNPLIVKTPGGERLTVVEGRTAVSVMRPGAQPNIIDAQDDRPFTELGVDDRFTLKDFSGPEGQCWFVRSPLSTAEEAA